MKTKFEIIFNGSSTGHLRKYKKFDRNRILDTIKEQLMVEPNTETKNKKTLRDNPLSDWELRIHPFRVFYDIDEEMKIVRILAIGHKVHNVLYIGGEEIDL